MPVNVGLARGALRAKALIDAVLRGLSKSVVLSTLANPTPDFVKLEASAFKTNAAIVAVDNGFNKSVVLSTLAKLTVVFVSPQQCL